MAILFKLVFALAVMMAAGYSQAFDPNGQPVGTGSGGTAAIIAEGITGTVTHRSGEPVAGAFVKASAVNPASGPIPDIAIVTGAGGNFAWPLRPGRSGRVPTGSRFSSMGRKSPARKPPCSGVMLPLYDCGPAS